MPIDLSIDPDLDPTDPSNYDGIPGEWDTDQPQIYHPDEDYPDVDQFEFIDDFEEDFAL